MDYTDPQRVKNVQLAKNVKLVEPNTTIIYACPLMPDKQEEISLVFIAPKVLNIEVGNILSSPQAGGIMHKILNVVDNGTYELHFFTLFNINLEIFALISYFRNVQSYNFSFLLEILSVQRRQQLMTLRQIFIKHSDNVLNNFGFENM